MSCPYNEMSVVNSLLISHTDWYLKKEKGKNFQKYYVKTADFWPEDLNSLSNSATNVSMKFRNNLNQTPHK